MFLVFFPRLPCQCLTPLSLHVCVCVCVCRGMPGPVVTIGLQLCGGVAWISDTFLTCVPASDYVVGAYPVSVSLPLDNATLVSAVTVMALCPPGWYGLPSETCSPCPSGSRCSGGLDDPVALAGYYPVGRAEFVECIPLDACVGAVNYTVASDAAGDVVACGPNYSGERCGNCRVGSYRLNGGCKTCPNTAWLLFLAFFGAIIVCVALAVWLSSKKINFAGLSIGVVSVATGNVAAL